MKVREIVNAFEGDGILVSNAKAAVNDPNVAKLLAKIPSATATTKCFPR